MGVIGFRLVDFFSEQIIVGSQIRHLWPRWLSPNVLACLNFNLTQGHPLVAKFSNMCHFQHFLRVPRKTKLRVYRENLILGFSPKFSVKNIFLNFSMTRSVPPTLPSFLANVTSHVSPPKCIISALIFCLGGSQRRNLCRGSTGKLLGIMVSIMAFFQFLT